MSQQQILPETANDKVPWRTVIRGLLAAILAAVIVNLIIYYIAEGAGALPDSVTFKDFNGNPTHINAASVISATVFGWLIGGVLLVILRAFTKRPLRIFFIVAIIAGLISLAEPFTIKDIPSDMLVTLLLMHFAGTVFGCAALNYVAGQDGV